MLLRNRWVAPAAGALAVAALAAGPTALSGWAEAGPASPRAAVRVGASDADPPTADNGGSIVEDYAYPGAAEVLASRNVKLISGDGHVLLADCSTPPVASVSVIKVYTSGLHPDGGVEVVCFKATASVGWLTLEVPGVFEIRGDGQTSGTGHKVTATIKPDDGAATTVAVNPSGSTPVGIGIDDDNSPTTLLQLKVTG